MPPFQQCTFAHLYGVVRVIPWTTPCHEYLTQTGQTDTNLRSSLIPCQRRGQHYPTKPENPPYGPEPALRRSAAAPASVDVVAALPQRSLLP